MKQLLDEGYVVMPSLFSLEEVNVMREAAEVLLRGDGPHMQREPSDARQVRMVFGGHRVDDTFARLARHPRILRIVESVLGEPAHVFQSRLNAKSTGGGGWAWHQDFNQWYRQDAMRTPRATVVGVFLDEVNACNGPLLLIPRSHRDGFIFVPDMMDIPAPHIARAADAHGIVPLVGPPGTTVFFDCLSIHGSAPNISPWPRRIFYFNYVPATTRELQPLREWFHCDCDVAPLEALDDDCLSPIAREA